MGKMDGKLGAAAAHLAPRRRCDLLAVAAVALVVLLAIALVPMVAISAFDHSYADDWHYGVDAYLALTSGQGIVGAVRAAVTEAADTYISWQGTYSAIVLMALQPGVFSEALYGIGAVAIIAVLVASTAYVVRVLMCDVLGSGVAETATVAAAALLLQTQLLPSPVEGFWWYNSAIYYTFYHALMLLGTGLAVRLVRRQGRRGRLSRAGVVLRAVLLTAIAFIIGGGNFVTAVVSAVALFGATAAVIARAPRRAVPLVPALVVLVAGFAFSAAAPGNAARQASQFAGDGIGVVGTLIASGLATVSNGLAWTDGWLALALATALPAMVRATRASRCSFSLPLAPAACSFVLLSASFTPTFYSMGSAGPGRVQNIRYDFFVLAVFLCVTWLVGWCVRRVERAERERGCAPGGGGVATADTAAGRRMRPLAWWYAAVAFVGVLGIAAVALDPGAVDDLTSTSAASSIATGEAAAYDEEVWERIALIEQGGDEVEVPYYTVGPKVLFMGDIHDNMGNYINFRLAQWYGKDSVVAYHAKIG